jgi:electron transfer flavoprotein alpha subunit
MKDAELVIAVNLDPKAPIFDIADYGAVVDLFELLPPLAAEAEKRRVLR